MVYPIQSKACFLQKFTKTSHFKSILKPARNLSKGVIP